MSGSLPRAPAEPATRRWAALFLVLAGGVTLAAQTPTFSVRTDAVRVDALVTERGQFVQGLSPADFEVRDNGVLQEVTLASLEELPLNVILVFDSSDSVSGARLTNLQDAGRVVLAALKDTDKAALLTFNHRIALRQELTGDVERLRRAIDGMQPEGRTSLVDGTFAGLQIGEADGGRDLVIVFSDGLDTTSWLTPERVIESARRADATVYAVSVRGAGRSRFLEDIARATGGDVVESETDTDLSATFVRILTDFRQRYVVTFSPRNVEKSGWHTLDVRVKNRRATVKARPGYFVR